jgi:hypothetical protein
MRGSVISGRRNEAFPMAAPSLGAEDPAVNGEFREFGTEKQCDSGRWYKPAARTPVPLRDRADEDRSP